MRILTITILGLLAISSCSKQNDNNVYQQAHDQNKVMKLMHNMMDSMLQMTATNDPDIDFAMMMKMHHQGAITMAQLEQAEGNDATMKQLAQSIITAQSQEIQELNAYLSSHMTPDNSNPEFSSKMADMMKESGRQSDLQVINGKVDEDFATLMIIHHESAVDMAHHYLLTGNELQLKTMAENIISSQGEEIATMQNWLLPFRRK